MCVFKVHVVVAILNVLGAYTNAVPDNTCQDERCKDPDTTTMLQGRIKVDNLVTDEGSRKSAGKATMTTIILRGDVKDVKIGSLSSPDSEVEIDLDELNMTFKNSEGYKKVDAEDVFVGSSSDGTADIELVSKPKIGGSGLDLFGSIVNTTSGKVYQIGPNANDELVVTETDTSDFPPESDAVESPEDGVNLVQKGSDNRVDSGDSIFDVLIVWTKKAECKIAGKSHGCTHTAQTEASMRGMLDLAIEETNAAYELSGVKADLRLVHAYRDDSYDESSGFSAALNAITSTTDGLMDDVHAKRAQYGADVVALIIDNSQYCGLAWLGPHKTRMFSVTNFRCATGYYSFGHEIAHNLGCNHDKGAAGACFSSAYNYGWRDPQAGFRSIMGYNCRAGQCDNNRGGGCTRVMRFSNPTYKYNGKAIGDAQHDNARKINDVRTIVAAYYPTKVVGTTTTTTTTTTTGPTTTTTTTTTEFCVDITVNRSKWCDSYGSAYDCDWYKTNDATINACKTDGHRFRNMGYVAEEACCVCGGGVRDPPSATTAAPPPATTVAPPPATTLAPQPPTTAAPLPPTTAAPLPPTTAAPTPATTAAPPATTVAPPPANTSDCEEAKKKLHESEAAFADMIQDLTNILHAAQKPEAKLDDMVQDLTNILHAIFADAFSMS